MCINCNEVLNNRKALWRHKKKCTGLSPSTIINNNDNSVTNNQTINNNLNLNINLFLNEKCKDAMNLKDFVDQIKMSLEILLSHCIEETWLIKLLLWQQIFTMESQKILIK